MKMEKILEIRELCKSYPGFELKDVSFCLEEGSIMGFVGRNGAGKSTTLRAILNFVHPDSGEVRLFGKLFSQAEDEIRQKIGFASSGVDYYPRKTLKQILENTRSFYPNWDAARCRELMERFGLAETKRFMDLSEGMKVKFHLVLALSHGARLLILDEPTSGLDPVSREELVVIFRQLAGQGVSILFSTHITSDLEKCADRVTYIQKGQILASENREDFLRHFAAQGSTLEEIMVNLEVNREVQI